MQKVKNFALISLSLFLLWGSPVGAQTQQNDDLYAQTRISVNGTPISIMLPDLFVFDETQSAYLYSGAAASIQIQYLQGVSLEQAIKGIDQSDMKGQGLEVVSREELKTAAGVSAYLVKTSLTAVASDPDKSVPYHRYIFVAGNAERTVYILANYPQVTESVLADLLKSALLSVEF